MTIFYVAGIFLAGVAVLYGCKAWRSAHTSYRERFIRDAQAKAYQRVSAVFVEAEEQMNRAAGRGFGYRLGSWKKWQL